MRFDAQPSETTQDDGWSIVLAYEDEGEGPWLIDLSHLQRLDYQHTRLDAKTPLDLAVPDTPGKILVRERRLIARLNASQAAIWHLRREDRIAPPAAPGFTETTEAQCMLAVVGRDAPFVMEHVSNLDLFEPARPMPFLTQGPVMHVPCQVATLARDCVIMAFSRGYGQTFAVALLRAASGCGLGPAGERRFTGRLGPAAWS